MPSGERKTPGARALGVVVLVVDRRGNRDGLTDSLVWAVTTAASEFCGIRLGPRSPLSNSLPEYGCGMNAQTGWFDQHLERIRRNQAAEIRDFDMAQVLNSPVDIGRLTFFTLRCAGANR